MKPFEPAEPSMSTIGGIFQSEAERSSRASEAGAEASVSERTRARELDRLTKEAARIRGELAELKTGTYNPREHPRRRAKLGSMLREIEKKLRGYHQGRLL